MPKKHVKRSLPNLVRLILTAVMLGVATLGSWSPAAASDHVEPGFVPLSAINGTLNFGLVPIGDGFFFAGSQQPTASVALRGLAFDTGTYGDAAIQIDIPSLEHDPGTPISGPVTITRLGLGPTDPIVIRNADGSIQQEWIFEVTLSPQVPQMGTLNVLESHPNGGSFNLELPFVPRMTFFNVDSGETRERDFGLMTQPYTIHLQGSSSWARFCPDRLHVPGETSNFCPGTDPTTGATFAFPLRDIFNGALNLTVERTAGMVAPNRPPVLDPIGPLEGLEGATSTFFFSATDPDGDDLVFSIANQPSYSQFVDNGDGSASFTVTAPFGSALELFDVTVTVTDDGSPPLNDQETFVLTILPGSDNTPPVLNPIADQTVREGERSEFLSLFEATDANGDIISLRADNLPVGCNLIPNASVPGTVIANLLCDPDVQPGSFTVTITATDERGASDSKSFTLTVQPFLDTGGDQTVVQDEQVQLNPTSSPGAVVELDLDNDGVFESPAPATFDATGLAPGDYLVGVRAFLNGVYNVGSITVTVLPRNNPPVLDPIGEFGMDEGQTLEKVITASDPDGDLLAFTLDFDGIGSFCELISSLGDTALLSCSTIGSTNPGIGRYRFTVTVTDNGMPPLSDSETFIVSVTPPLLLIEPINSTLDEEFVPLDVSSTSPGVQFSWDFNNDGVFDDAFGEVVSFSLLGLVPGFYPVKVQGCVDVPNDVPVCNEAETGVNVLPADPDEPPSFDGLRSLVRDNVSSPAVKFTLLLVLNLAEFLDRAGALTAAERTLETFIRLVERFTPRFISPEAAEQMIQMADDLIDLLFD